MNPVPSWDGLVELGARVGDHLRRRRETLAVAEGSAGGLISAALLAVPGASAYFVGGAIVYTPAAHRAFIAGTIEVPEGMRGATETFASYLATAVAVRTAATWGIGEAGAAGPPNRYGDPAGHVWLAVTRNDPAGDHDTLTEHLLTGIDDRETNMRAFAAGALELLLSRLAPHD
jgi:PncC family amidohydrolase